MKKKTSVAQTPAKPHFGVALAGGGFFGAVYELGALAALEEAIDGLDWRDARALVGVSAGAFVAAGLANGIAPREMVRLFVSGGQKDGFDPASMLRPNLAEISQRLLRVPSLLASASLHYATHHTNLMASFKRLGKALPTGFFDPASGEKFLAQLFEKDGRTNDFRKLKTKLRVVATNLDTGEAVEFGGAGRDDVPISRAVLASASLPGVFPPTRIGEDNFVDGALKKTLHASVALDAGVPLLFCFNPIVPLDISKSTGKTRKLADAGLPGVMAQTLRSLIHSRMAVGMGRYSAAYPNTDIVLFEPDHGDDEIFFVNILATAGRQRLCEHAYRATRSQLWQRRKTLAPLLAKHGLTLNLAVLEDEQRSLMHKADAPSAGWRDLARVATKLGAQLDALAPLKAQKKKSTAQNRGNFRKVA